MSFRGNVAVSNCRSLYFRSRGYYSFLSASRALIPESTIDKRIIEQGFAGIEVTSVAGVMLVKRREARGRTGKVETCVPTLTYELFLCRRHNRTMRTTASVYISAP